MRRSIATGQLSRDLPRIRVWAVSCALALALAMTGCVETGYVVQAGLGQLNLWGKARPIEQVIADPDTSARTRVLLSEVAPILRFARDHGLATRGNYTRYVELDQPSVVWFLAASRPLSFTPRVWSFPIVGSFTYLGWFQIEDARRMRRSLAREGWDVHVRSVHAYSTGGWFRDPVLSSMLSPDDDAFRALAHVLLHELTHANILVNDQSTFNESVASFVGDTMTAEYLAHRFGPGSAEVAAFRADQAEDRRRGVRLASAYRELDRLYGSDVPDADKRANKQRLLRVLADELAMRYVPNNASLLSFKTYNAGMAEFEQLLETCQRDWKRFLAAIKTITPRSFPTEQAEDIGPVIAGLARAGCPVRRRRGR